MANRLASIKSPVAAELEIFETKFRDAMKSQVPLLDRITYYIVKRKGKQMRPMFVFLAARLFGETNESTYNAASLVELLHTATLVHDDVVDDAHLRRGFFSVNALWKNKIAVLVGDYLLSQGLLLALDNGHFEMLQIVSNAVKAMSEGELLQIEKARRLDIDESVYYEIIKGKTASLIAAACAAGACSTTDDEKEIESARLLGEKIGMAFQIKDDLMDLGDDDIGKPKGIDIKEKKMTLPLIYALQQASNSEKRRIIRIVKKNKKDKKHFLEVINFIKDKGGLDYAREKMYDYRSEALQILDGMVRCTDFTQGFDWLCYRKKEISLFFIYFCVLKRSIMDLTSIVSVSGLSGLYEMVGNKPSGLVVKHLETGKTRFASARKHNFSPLASISIFTITDTVEVIDVLYKMKENEEKLPPPETKSDPDDLRDYMYKIVEDHDEDRVYVSDIKKLIKWYNFLNDLNLLDNKDASAEEE